MVDALVYEVRSETTRANISHASQVKNRAVKAEQKSRRNFTPGLPQNAKRQGFIKGKSAFGCGNYKAGCDFVLPFSYADKKISENQYLRLLQKARR